LIHACQIKEIVVLSEGRVPIGIGGHKVIGIEERQRGGLQFFYQSLSIGSEQLLIDFFVAHSG
jgi:hypothetical protein